MAGRETFIAYVLPILLRIPGFYASICLGLKPQDLGNWIDKAGAASLETDYS